MDWSLLTCARKGHITYAPDEEELRVGALVLNIGLIVYIVVTKRLFGVRGGRAAHEAHLRSESLIEVEQATRESDLRHPSPPEPEPAG